MFLKQHNQEIKMFCCNLGFSKRKLKLEQLLKRIHEDTIYGLAQVDIKVPDHLREYFAELPPIFKNTTIERSNLRGHMRDFAENNGLMKNGWRCLVASYFGEKLLMTTDYIKWCLNHGLIVENCYLLLEYRRQQPFKHFIEFVSRNRRRGDYDSSLSVIAETSKLLGNSAYGIQLINKSKFENTVFADKETVVRKINSNLFKSYDEIDGNLFEMKMFKKKIVHNEPITVGFAVLNNAKQRMLEFRYDFLGVIMRPSTFRLIEMDTDSLYLALNETDLEECFHTDSKSAYNQWKQDSCALGFGYEPDNTHGFLTRTCCDEHIKYDSRTPGLFKVEWNGTEMVCLNSKTYCTVNQHNGTVKFAMKGTNKTLDSPLSKYLSVLRSKQPYEGVNRGFRVDDGCMKTYEQHKKSVTYFYCKRLVLEDGVTTSPLDI